MVCRKLLLAEAISDSLLSYSKSIRPATTGAVFQIVSVNVSYFLADCKIGGKKIIERFTRGLRYATPPALFWLFFFLRNLTIAALFVFYVSLSDRRPQKTW